MLLARQAESPAPPLWVARQAALREQYDLEALSLGERASLAMAALDLASVESSDTACILVYRDSRDANTGVLASRTLTYVAAAIDGFVLDAFALHTSKDWRDAWRHRNAQLLAGNSGDDFHHRYTKAELVWPQGIAELIEECRAYSIPLSRAKQSEYMLALGGVHLHRAQCCLVATSTLTFS